VTNTEIRKRLNIKKDLIQAVMRRRLGLFGHVCRMENNIKIIDVKMGMQRMNGWHKGLLPDRCA